MAFALIGNAPSFTVMRRLQFSPDGTFEGPWVRHGLYRRMLRSDVSFLAPPELSQVHEI